MASKSKLQNRPARSKQSTKNPASRGRRSPRNRAVPRRKAETAAPAAKAEPTPKALFDERGRAKRDVVAEAAAMRRSRHSIGVFHPDQIGTATIGDLVNAMFADPAYESEKTNPLARRALATVGRLLNAFGTRDGGADEDEVMALSHLATVAAELDCRFAQADAIAKLQEQHPEAQP